MLIEERFYRSDVRGLEASAKGEGEELQGRLTSERPRT